MGPCKSTAAKYKSSHNALRGFARLISMENEGKDKTGE